MRSIVQSNQFVKALFLSCFLPLVVLGLSYLSQDLSKNDAVSPPAEIIKNMMNLLYYQRDYLRLSEELTAYSPEGQKMTKKHFLEQLTTGRYLPLRLKTGGSNVYRLQRLTNKTGEGIRAILKQTGQRELAHFQLEGKPFPHYRFTDLKGNVYTPQNTKGKIVVLNCWFIHCQACNEEMPQLNDLVQRHHFRKDILFISLATDGRAELKTYLVKKQFDYQTVPDQDDLIEKKLKIHEFPTSLIIGKDGLIKKVIDTPKELAVALAKEASKS